MPYKPVIESLPIVAREVELELAKKLWDDLGHLHQRYMLALAHTRTHTELSCVIHLSCVFAHVHLQAYEKRSSARGRPYGPPTNALVGRHLGLGQIHESDEQPMCSHRLSSVSKVSIHNPDWGNTHSRGKVSSAQCCTRVWNHSPERKTGWRVHSLSLFDDSIQVWHPFRLLVGDWVRDCSFSSHCINLTPQVLQRLRVLV